MITKINIDEVKENPSNPRTIKEGKFKKLVKSIQEFPRMLEIRPIVVDQNMIVLGGNMRLKACKAAGLKQVHIIKVDDLTPEQQKEFVIKDNSGFGEWDWKELELNWDLGKLDTWGMDLPDFLKKSKAKDSEDFVRDVETPTSIVKGDLIEIGPHRLLCGSSLDAGDYAKLIGGETPQILVTDPPYGIDLETDYSKMPSTKNKYKKIEGDELEFDVSDVISISNTQEQYIWGGDYFVKSLDWASGTQIIWSKRFSEQENKVFGSAYESLWVSYKCKKQIWFVRQISQSSERLGKHPTQKPVECMRRCIEMSKLPGPVYDAFIGSGSTMVAAHQLGRTCFGMELQPEYCQVIVDRMLMLYPELTVRINGVKQVI